MPKPIDLTNPKARRRLETQILTEATRSVRLRDRAELAIPAQMMWRVVSGIYAHRLSGADEIAFCQSVLPDLDQARLESFAGLHPLDAENARSLSANAVEVAFSHYYERSVVFVTLMAAHWLKGMIESDHLVLVEGSAFDRAAQRILDAIFEHGDLVEGLDKSARKQAKRIDESLYRMGFYRYAREVAA